MKPIKAEKWKWTFLFATYWEDFHKCFSHSIERNPIKIILIILSNHQCRWIRNTKKIEYSSVALTPVLDGRSALFSCFQWTIKRKKEKRQTAKISPWNTHQLTWSETVSQLLAYFRHLVQCLTSLLVSTLISSLLKRQKSILEHRRRLKSKWRMKLINE